MAEAEDEEAERRTLDGDRGEMQLGNQENRGGQGLCGDSGEFQEGKEANRAARQKGLCSPWLSQNTRTSKTKQTEQQGKRACAHHGKARFGKKNKINSKIIINND